MSDAKVMDAIEEAPHIELNMDGSSIDISNWSEPANRNWSYRHTVDVLPFTRKISRGQGALHEFKAAPRDLSSIQVNYRDRDMLLEEYLKESHCDGLIVLKGNDIVYENYRRMAPEDRHLCQSVTKTTVCAVIGSLVADDLIDPRKTVDSYIPRLASGFAGVPVQDLLDMNVALDFSEDFTDPNADIYEYEMLTGWHPDTGGQADGVFDYISKLERDPAFQMNGATNYLCPNTDMLGFIIEKVTGRSFAEVFQENIYRHIGAEADAYYCTDAKGGALCSAGLILRLRDLARYAQIFANKGIANDGTQVIPLEWIEECLDTSRGTSYYMGRNYQYHNQITSNGRALCHLGVGGQMMYANTETQVVVVQFSTTSAPSNGDLDFGNALVNIADAISEFLSNG
ncbi:MAG: serine hydrolase [Halieaceae bacterium]|jgi:CubicO group peptidase (beta-lactamase class C family)